MRFLFLAAAFLSSALLFVVEPLAAKLILPTFGGAPQVWNSSLLFFQIALLLGYLYAHLNARRLGNLRGRFVHLGVALLAMLALPISIHRSIFSQVQNWAAADGPPIPLVLLALAGLVGLPFFALSANSSTLQRWYSLSGQDDAAEPWFLYSAGNVGSMLALIAYPVILEPTLTLSQQGRFWAGAYMLLFVLLAACAWSSHRSGSKNSEAALVPETEAGLPASGTVIDEPGNLDLGGHYHRAKQGDLAEPLPVGRNQKLLWLALAAVPSSLLLGVTTYLTTNLAPIPLLWVVPLTLYLLTFILVFARKPNAPAALLGRIYPIALTPLIVIIALENVQAVAIPIHLLVFFLACWMCHSRLVLAKPVADHLTEFYFYISLGGVLGGTFNAMIAPTVFNSVFEYPLALVAAALLMPQNPKAKRRPGLDIAYPVAIACLMLGLVFAARLFGLEAGPERTFLTIGVPCILCFLAVDSPTRFALSIAAGVLVAMGLNLSSDGTVLLSARSFFGVHRVIVKHQGKWRQLMNGNTIHGIQNFDHPRLPLTYYYPGGPIGLVMNEVQPRTAAFVGLGVGSLAAYGKPGQQFTYYEIDPVVKQIATDPRYFTFLRDSEAKVNIVLGDARLELARTSSKYDLIVVDAFSSDSIPIHLLTKEAIEMYLSHLNQNGILAFHISNRYLELEPILGAASRRLQLIGLTGEGAPLPEEADLGATQSKWVLLAPDMQCYAKLHVNHDWSDITEQKTRLWTDDYSDVIAVFNPNR